MSDDCDSISNSEDWVLYRDRPEWKDIIPVEQDDGPCLIVSIQYSEKFKDIFDYFRAVVSAGEMSERALALTEDAIQQNPASYTVWQFRREVLRALNKDLLEELRYISDIIKSNPKNYQVWHHRKAIAEWQNDDSSLEMELTELILVQDPKNYHAWQHRQWTLSHFKCYKGELEYVNRLLDEDVRNNSAWNQRYFVIKNTTGFVPEVISREVDYTLNKISQVTFNESSWNYLKGITRLTADGLSGNSKIVEFCEQLYSSSNRSPHLLSTMFDICCEKIDKNVHDKNTTLQDAIEICDLLINEHDKIRKEYWNYKARSLAQKVNPIS